MLDKLSTELKIRGFTARTQKAYLFHNSKFLEFTNKDPSVVTEDDIKAYMAYLIADKGLKPSSVNLALSSLKFFFKEIVSQEY